jgi:hypothetical protein
MSVEFARALVGSLALYLGLGALFAIAFHWRGAARIDALAGQGSLGFRILVTPGVIALWPLLALRWRRATGEPPEPHDAHRDAAVRGAPT